MKPNMRDSSLSITRALPAGATTVIAATFLDVGPVTAQGNFAPCVEGEFLLEAPALLTAQLPDATTVTYDFIESDNADFSSPVVIRKSALIQTGAGGVGAAAATARYRPSMNPKRYQGFQIIGVATVAATGATATMTYVV